MMMWGWQGRREVEFNLERNQREICADGTVIEFSSYLFLSFVGLVAVPPLGWASFVSFPLDCHTSGKL